MATMLRKSILAVVLTMLAWGAAGEAARAADAVNGAYSFSISRSGTPQSQTLSVTINPDASLVGQVGALFIWARMPNGEIFSYTSAGWQPQGGGIGDLPAYTISASLPASTTITAIPRLDMSRYIGAVIYAGYGTTVSAMLANNSLAPVFVEVAEAERNGVIICKDTKFALCAASTCTATGGTVTDNQGVTFPAATCTCPILRADNFADLRGGNQEGSCVSPDPAVIWSTFSPVTSYPQLINGTWQTAPAPQPGLCYSPNQYAQCWNWKCSVIAPINGFEMAQCTCPLQTSAVWGQNDYTHSCASMPVGIFLPPSYDPTASSSSTPGGLPPAGTSGARGQ